MSIITKNSIVIKGQCYLDGKEISTEEAIGMILKMGEETEKQRFSSDYLFTDFIDPYVNKKVAEEKARLIRVIEGMKKEILNKIDAEDNKYWKVNRNRDLGYNQALSDILKELSKE